MEFDLLSETLKLNEERAIVDIHSFYAENIQNYTLPLTTET